MQKGQEPGLPAAGSAWAPGPAHQQVAQEGDKLLPSPSPAPGGQLVPAESEPLEQQVLACGHLEIERYPITGLVELLSLN